MNEKPNSPLAAGIHSRGYLPHLKGEGKSYFVTFRLSGTLPPPILLKFKQEREHILQNALANNRPLTRQEEDELFRWYSTRVDAYLDTGHGECFLLQPKIADLVSSAMRFFEKQRYELHAWAVMPNHVHVVLWPKTPHLLSEILHSWKSYTATQANKILNRRGEFWQRESYDHLIRDDDDLARCCRYTIQNPVSANLCNSAAGWPWSSSYIAAGSCDNQQAKMPALQRDAL